MRYDSLVIPACSDSGVYSDSLLTKEVTDVGQEVPFPAVTLDTTTASKTMDGGPGDTLDIVTSQVLSR